MNSFTLLRRERSERARCTERLAGYRSRRPCSTCATHTHTDAHQRVTHTHTHAHQHTETRMTRTCAHVSVRTCSNIDPYTEREREREGYLRQHTATHDALHTLRTTTHYNTCRTVAPAAALTHIHRERELAGYLRQHTATHYALQSTATHCNTLQHTTEREVTG